MKKIIQMIQVWISKLFKKTVSPIDEITLQLGEKKQTLQKIKNSYYIYKGKFKFFTKELEEANRQLDRLMASAKKCKEEEDEVLLKRCFEESKILKARIKNLEKNVELSKKMCDETYKQKNELESIVSKLTSDLDSLKMQNQFAKDVDKFIKVTETSFSDNDTVKEATKEIEVNFYSSEKKIEDYEDSKIDSIHSDDDFEEFKCSIS